MARKSPGSVPNMSCQTGSQPRIGGYWKSSHRALFSSRLTAEMKLIGYGVIKGGYYNRTQSSRKIMLALYSGR